MNCGAKVLFFRQTAKEKTIYFNSSIPIRRLPMPRALIPSSGDSHPLLCKQPLSDRQTTILCFADSHYLRLRKPSLVL